MAVIQRCCLTNFRNISIADLNFAPRFNIFYGENGAGKTSLLESIYLLANGHSFRSSMKSQLIQHHQEGFVLFVELENAAGQNKIGLEKTHQGNLRLQVNGVKSHSLAKAAELLPVILIDPHSQGIIEEGPVYRRQYLDWLLFHVEPSYYEITKQYADCLQQRNAAIRQKQDQRYCKSWDGLIASFGEQITTARREILAKLTPYYQQQIEQLRFNHAIQINYYPGWDEQITLQQALELSFYKDLALGYTSVGPQRADIKLSIDHYPAADTLSRGQGKLALAALLFAQGKYYDEYCQEACIYLIDDFTAELDKSNRDILLNHLNQLAGQFFITSLEEDLLKNNELPICKTFHVKHGAIVEDPS